MAEKKTNLKTVLIIIAGIIGYSLMLFVLNPYIQKQENPKEKVENKVIYIKSDITKKYPNDFKDKKELLKKIKAQIANKYESINDGKQTSIYKDSNGRVVYIKIEEIKAVKNFLGGKSGYSFKRFYPDEEGYLYNKEGKVIKKIEIKSSYESCYFVSSLDDIKRKSYFDDEETGGTLSIITIGYDEKGNRIREESVKPSSWYEKEITEYSSGKKKSEKKIIDYEVDAEQYNKIYVEITKEYDENEKLIKKFVLRKNKFNAVRSETNFDFIKGEIVTKYYDGEKAFATVTETLIGKDRAIVKRERVGDNIKIFDYVEYLMLDKIDNRTKKHFYEIKNKRFVFNLNNEMMFKVEYFKKGDDYYDTTVEGPIDYSSYRYEGYFETDDKDEYTKISSEINNIFEIKKINNNESEVTEWEINREEYLKVLKDIMVGKLDNKTKENLIKKNTVKIKIEELNNEFKNIMGGIKQ